MNKKLIWIIPVLMIAGVLIYYFTGINNKKTTHLKMVPLDSEYVLKVNLKSLYDKITSDDIHNLKDLNRKVKNFSKSMNSNALEYIIKSAVSQPVSCGIDLKSDLYVFTVTNETENITGYSIGIKDMDNFNRMILKMPSVETELRRTKDFYIINESETCLTWNENGLLILVKDRKFLHSGYKNGLIDENLDVFSNLYMNLTQDYSVLSNKNFLKWSKEDHDASVYLAKQESHDIGGIDKFLESFNIGGTGISVGLFLDFNQDEIVLETKLFGDEALIKQFILTNKKGIKPEIINKVCATDPIAIAGFNVNIDKSFDYLLKYIEAVDLSKEKFLEMTGLTFEEMETCFNGEIGIAFDANMESVNKMSDEMKMYGYNAYASTVFNVYIGIKNKKNTEKLLSKIFSLKDSIGYQVTGSDAYIIVKDDYIFYSDLRSNTDKINKSGVLNDSKSPVYNQNLHENPGFCYINLNKTSIDKIDKLHMFQNMNGSEKKIWHDVVSNFKGITYITDADNVSKLKVEMLKNKDLKGNSLQRLTTLFFKYN